MMPDLFLVTGAPGSGKSTTLESLLAMNSDYLALDIDWLADAASELAGKDIYSDPSTWKPYSKLWFDVLHSLYRNSLQPIFFCPNTPDDIEAFGKPAWCNEIHWLLLDCSDDVRMERLEKRPNWNDARKLEAIGDAVELRDSISRCIDTGISSPEEVVSEVIRWANSMGDSS